MEQKSLNLHISNFVRPFTLVQAKALIEDINTVDYFWMDSIKSQCFVSVSSQIAADNIFQALNNYVWPEETGKALSVRYVSSSELPKQGEFSR